MDIRDEIKAFKGDKSTKSSSLPDFDQNKPQNLDNGVKGRIGRVSPMKSKVTNKSDSHKSMWVPITCDIVLSPHPISQYNPFTSQVVKESDTALVVIEKSTGKPVVVKEKPNVVKEKPIVVKEKPDVVKEKLTVVKKKPAVVKEKPVVVKDKRKTEKNSKSLDNPKESDKAADVIESDKHKDDVVKPSNVVAYKAINVVADKVDVAKDKINVQDDPANVVKESVLAVAKNKPSRDGKNYAPDVVKERRKTMLLKYKPNNKAPSVGKSNVPTELHKDKVLDFVSKDKPKGNASSVVVSFVSKGQALNVVSKDKPKGNALSELPKNKDKADIPKDKHKVHSEVHVLRSKHEVKAKSSVCEDVKSKRILSKEDHSKKKPEVDSDSSSDEVTKEKLATICSERVFPKDLLMKASSVYPRDEMFVKLYENYFQLFKEQMLFNDDVNMNGNDDVRGDGEGDGDDDGNGDDDARGDSDVNQDDDNAGSGNDDGNRDDDVGGDGDGNEDDVGNEDDDGNRDDDVRGDGDGNGDDTGNGDDDGNGDDVDGNDHGDGNLNRDDYDRGCKSIEKQVDATTKENVVEGESNYITCTPESYTQWLDANSDFVIKMIDCIGEALDTIDEVM
nr:hypothetical protein [Tanacetum cinerariifolium]